MISYKLLSGLEDRWRYLYQTGHYLPVSKGGSQPGWLPTLIKAGNREEWPEQVSKLTDNQLADIVGCWPVITDSIESSDYELIVELFLAGMYPSEIEVIMEHEYSAEIITAIVRERLTDVLKRDETASE